ncbi:PASTA domain-containing protein [Streptomyces sp. YIM S03343]
MRTRTIATALTAAALLALTACESADDSSPSKPDTSSPTKQDDSTTEATTKAPADGATTDKATPETATLPNLVGKDLQDAQDEAQAAGFYVLDDQDASGQHRLQVFDRNWTVCSQEPEAGTHPTDTPVTLYAVKDNETC